MKHYIILITLILILYSCNQTNSETLNEFIIGDWYYFEHDSVSSINDSGIIDSVFIDSTYFEAFFDGKRLNGYNSYSGQCISHYYRLSHDTIKFYYDSVDTNSLYFTSVIKKINDTSFLSSNDAVNVLFFKIKNSDFKYSKMQHLLDSISFNQTDKKLYDSIRLNLFNEYYKYFVKREHQIRMIDNKIEKE